MNPDYLSIIIREFNTLSQQAKSQRLKGWQFKVKNYNRVVSILNTTDSKLINDTNSVLELLKDAGMKFTGDKIRNSTDEKKPWKSKILSKIDDIFTLGYLPEAKTASNDPKTIAINTLTSIPEIGPSKADKLYQLGINNIPSLINYLEKDNTILNRKQIIALRHYKDLAMRISRKEMDDWKEFLELITNPIVSGYNIKNYNTEMVGSYRRETPDSGDVDFYISLPDNTTEETCQCIMEEIRDELINIGSLNKDDCFSCGSHKLMCVAKIGPKNKMRHIDIFIFKNHQTPYAILHATGCGEFNIKLRNRALNLGWSLSEKGLTSLNNENENKTIDTLEQVSINLIKTERHIFEFLKIKYIQPKYRTPHCKFTLL